MTRSCSPRVLRAAEQMLISPHWKARRALESAGVPEDEINKNKMRCVGRKREHILALSMEERERELLKKRKRGSTKNTELTSPPTVVRRLNAEIIEVGTRSTTSPTTTITVDMTELNSSKTDPKGFRLTPSQAVSVEAVKERSSRKKKLAYRMAIQAYTAERNKIAHGKSART